MSEEIPLTLSKLLNDYDTLIVSLNDRVKNPEKSGFFSSLGKGPPSPPKESDAARYKQCIIGFRAPLLHALKLRTNTTGTFGNEFPEEKAQGATYPLQQHYGTTTKLSAASELRSYLQVGEEGQEGKFVPSTKESGNVTPSKYSDIRVKYVDYMTRALKGLISPDTPCRSFTRLKNLIDDTTTKETGLNIRELIAKGEKVMAKPEEADTQEVRAEAKKVAAAATEGKPFGGRKRRTRRKRNIRRRKTTTRRCW
jgi:hypothetical protein